MWYEDALELALEDEGMPYDPEEDEWDELADTLYEMYEDYLDAKAGYDDPTWGY